MFLLLVAALILTYALYQYTIARRLPPGPLPFLILGNLPQLFWYATRKGGFVRAMQEFQQHHGDVYTLWIGPMYFVNICTYEKAKDLMITQGHTQVGRFLAPFALLAEMDDTGKIWGIGSSVGETWTEHRRFALQTLRNFGMGKNLMEQRIIQEFDHHLTNTEKNLKSGKVEVNSLDFVNMLIGNLINRLLFGYRFETDESRDHFFRVKNGINELAESVTPVDYLIWHWWKYVPLLSRRYTSTMEAIEPVLKLVQDNVDRRIREIASGDYTLHDEPGDYIDAYLLEQRRRGDDIGEMTTHGLVIDLFDLWQAGQDTTSTTIQWGLFLFMKNLAAMKRCQDEILRVTSQNRNLSLTDRASTPYFTAACTEIQRHASILAFNLWRRTTGPSKISGYDIPIGTLTTAQLSVILDDPKVFEQTEKFSPERYLGENGKESCPGEGMAKAEIYLILGNLLNRYNLTPSPTLPPTGPTSGLSATALAVLKTGEECINSAQCEKKGHCCQPSFGQQVARCQPKTCEPGMAELFMMR
ncbi:unnamed protein product, partial [Mesorhabditis spiculigera]